MDMAPDAVDDQYNGCRKEALETFIHSGLLRQELNNSEIFQQAWNRNKECSKSIPGGEKEHAVALSTYANEDNFISHTFNTAVKTQGTNSSTYANFNFKSLHFLLMDSLKQLNSSDCKAVYFSPEPEINYEVKTGSVVRFGTFLTVYLSLDAVPTDLDDVIVFNITSCFFAKLGDNSCTKDKKSALLSPAEEFTVEGIFKKQYGDAEYTEVVLKHSRMNSFNNCYLFPR